MRALKWAAIRWWGNQDGLDRLFWLGLLGLLLVVALAVAFVLMVPSSALAGGDPGEMLFYNLKPSCAICHNEKQGNLAYSQAPRDYVQAIIARGKSPDMPAYRLPDRDLEALTNYVMALRHRSAK